MDIGQGGSYSASVTPSASSAFARASSAFRDGSSVATAIDVESVPSRPATVPATPNSSATVNAQWGSSLALSNGSTIPKKPVCIGAFMSRAIMLYPTPAAVVGAMPPPGSKERWDIVNFRGVEMIKVKLKLRRAGTMARPDAPWTGVAQDAIQVVTPGLTSYIGDLDSSVAEILIPMLMRGLCRLEGFAMRLNPDGPMFEVRINVLIFTLPSNISYIAETLIAHHLFLLDPMPPYDPDRHGDHPEYINAHGGGAKAYKMYLDSQRSQSLAGLGGYGGAGSSTASGSFNTTDRDKAKQVEVQRAQVDEVFKSIANGMELEQSDPGPWIKTELFPHQRKALTFLLQGEQDWSSLKQARKLADKHLNGGKKKKLPTADAGVTAKAEDGASVGDALSTNGDSGSTEKERSQSRDTKEDSSRSLWEGEKDEKGRLRIWKNKITGEKIRAKKGDRPKNTKGAILADDMGLGKTLSVVSLIAATRSAARSWGRKELESVNASSGDEDDKPSKISVSSMATRVFGMPEDDSDNEATGKGKKRKLDVKDDSKSALRARRATIMRRSKATLLVCPMSTITNWEDQIKEHWDGKVEVVGGQSSMTKSDQRKRGKKDGEEDEIDPEWDTLRIYIYHGTSRRADARFLAEFDIVITSYSTLANEYSKELATCGGEEDSTPAETGTNSSDEGITIIGGPLLAPAHTKPEVEAEIKAAEIAEALRRSKMRNGGGGGGKKKGGVESPSALQAIDWFRIVLDEAHYIKSSSTVACKASCHLEADRRIALTGTPIQNKIEDIWALFKFLRLSPVDDKEVFSKYITSPCKTGEQIGIARLQLVMRTCTLRRTKDSTTEDGRKILSLPPRKEIQQWLPLREDERTIYDQRLHEVQQEVNELQAAKQLTKNYAHVLQHLLRLRQTCNHIDLPASGPVEEDYDGTVMDYEVAVQGIERHGLNQARAVSVVCFLKDSDGALCAECGFDYGMYFPSMGLVGVEDDAPKPETVDFKKGKKAFPKPILTKCKHIHCPACFKRSVWPQYPKNLKGNTRQCGICQTMLQLDYDIIDVVPPDSAEQAEEQQPPKRSARKKWVRPPGERPNLSTKMQYLHDELLRFSKRNKYSVNYDPWFEKLGDGDDGEIIELDEDGAPLATKSVVFSQWTTMLDRIGDMLDEANINYCRLDGTMTREERAKAMDDLRTKKKIEVMLVSTRAGGVGLNLTAASRAYLVDPYWNPSVEAQAIDRIHRMGQKRPVTAIKLMIENSVEEKLAQIQKKKADLAQLSLKNMSRKELLEQKAEELASLFS